MDKQKTQRIIGILVIIAFVIILIPLFFGKTDVSTQVASTQVAPPLPAEQPSNTTTLASADSAQEQVPTDSAILNSGAAGANQAMTETQDEPTDSAIPTTTAQPATGDSSAAAPSMPSAPSTPNTDSAASATNTPTDSVTIDSDVANQINNSVSAPPTEIQGSEQATPPRDTSSSNHSSSAKPKKHSLAATTHSSHTHKVKPVNLSSAEIEKLTSTAWAIQMGNFKSKDNARRLADKLREAGYKAFTKEMTAANGSVTTRVYIGPEFKQASAQHLSGKVEQQFKMHGIVVSIKPLEL